MKAILYARFSPGKNKEKESGNDQLQELRHFCDKEGYEIEGEFVDENLTGKSADRPALWEAIESLKKGYILLARDMDRLARNTMLSINLEMTVASKGASIVTLKGTDSSDDSPEAVLMRRMMQCFAEFERANIARRTSAAMRLRLKRGLVVGGNQPYGWMRNPENVDELIKNSIEVAMIEKIHGFVAAGFTSISITGMLNERGYTKRNGSPWDRTTVSRIIKRESA